MRLQNDRLSIPGRRLVALLRAIDVERAAEPLPEAARANTESYLGLFRILSLEMWMRAFNVS